jgi:hypothetical protein
LLTAFAAIASCLVALSFQSRTGYGQTWVGPNNNANDPGSGNWTVGANWSTGGVVSNALNTFVFNTGTASYAATDDSILERFQLNSITFGVGAGNKNITVQGNGGVSANDPSLKFVSTPGNPNPPTPPSITNNAGPAQSFIRNDLFLGDTVTFGGTGTGKTTLTGVIAGLGGLAVTGSALAIDSTIDGPNFSTFTGGINQTGGTVYIGSGSDLFNVRIGAPASPGIPAAPTGPISVTGNGSRMIIWSTAREPTAGIIGTSTGIYSGSLTVGAGATVQLSGNFNKSFIDTTATPGATVTVNGRLKGVGLVRTQAVPTGTGKIQRGVTITRTGSLVPGDDPGELAIAGGLEMDPGSVFAPIIDGSSPAADGGTTGYSTANVLDSGTQLINDPSYQTDGSGNTAAGPILAPELDYLPGIGDKLFLLINNDVAPDSPGYFYDQNGNELGPDDSHDILIQSTVDNNYYAFQVDYHGDSATGSLAGGQDLVLISVPEPTCALTILGVALGGLLLRRRGTT